jgi:glycosyltransferase involved in cell wall biosynthesis
MKVAFDSRALAEPNSIGRYSRCLLKALYETAAVEDQLIETRRPSATLRSREADVLHSPWMAGAILHSPCATVVTIHDVAALKRRSEHLRGGLRLRLRHLAVQRAMKVIVPTKAVASDAVAHLGLERDRVIVVAEAADAAMYPRSAAEVAWTRARFGLPERYLVWVGGLQHPTPGRHLARLAGTDRELALVLVGPTRPWVHELPDVLLTGQVSDEQLAAIYSGAHALMIASEGAGFGLPAVEALACGTPVVACETPALREVLGDRATFVAPGDMSALIAAGERAQRPAPPAPSWSWQDAARATWAIYAEAAGASERSSSRLARSRATRTPGADGLEAQ